LKKTSLKSINLKFLITKMSGSIRVKLVLSFLIPVLFIIVLGIFGYMKYVKEPREREAQSQIFMAQRYFEIDSFSHANPLSKTTGLLYFRQISIKSVTR